MAKQNNRKNILTISPETIAAAVSPVIKRRARGLGAKSKEYRKPNGSKGAQPALFLLNHLRQPVNNELTHVYITNALRGVLTDIADKFHAAGMICGSPNKVLSVVVNTPQFESLLSRTANQMLAHIASGAARFEFDAGGLVEGEEEQDAQTATEG